MKKIGITGGTGFVGQHLTDLLMRTGYDVVILTRSYKDMPARNNLTYAHWDAEKGSCDINAIRELDGVVHLAGAGIADKRWTKTRKQEIVNSRVKGTEVLVAKLREYAPACKTFVAASATGYYGADRAGGTPFRESDPPCNDFLGDTCRKWEATSVQASDFARTVILRFGIVLGKEGGAFPKFAGPMSFGIMPILGSGRQVVSWIQIDDLANLILFALEHKEVEGVYNAVAPNPLTHLQLMKAIAAAKGGLKIPAPAPAFLLKILLGAMSEEVLKSCTVSAQKTTASGFAFEYPDIKSAVEAIVRPISPK